MKKKDLLVIMPAHNEAQNLPELFKQMEEAGISQMADVLVIDDASSDHTARIAAEWGHKVVSNVFCLGYGGAIQEYAGGVQVRGASGLSLCDSDGR